MARPKPEKVFGTQPSGEIFTIEGYVKPEKPERVVVFGTEPSGIIHTIEGYVKPENHGKPPSVFGTGQGTPFNFGLGFKHRLSITNIRLDFCHSGACRATAGAENQGKGADFFSIYVQFMVDGKISHNTKENPVQQYRFNMNVYNSAGIKIGGGSRIDYLGIEQFTGAYQKSFPDKRLQIEAWIVSNKIIGRSAKNNFPIYERISNIATGTVSWHTPEPETIPEPELLTLENPYSDFIVPDPLMDRKEVVQRTPAEPDFEASGQKEVPGSSTINLLPYVIGVGVAIGVGSVVLRKKGGY